MLRAAIGCALLCATPAYAQVSLSDVQEAIRKSKAPWQASDSRIAERFQNQKNPFGLSPMPDLNHGDDTFAFERDDFAAYFNAPAIWDWRDVNGDNWLTPIRDQGRCGSCVAFAALGVVESLLKITNGTSRLSADLSEQYLFSDIGTCDRGSQLGSATSSLRSRGTPDEACIPYVSGRTGADVWPKSCPDLKSRLVKISGSRNYSSAAAIKRALLDGPLMTSMTVYDDFMYYSGGIYQYVTGRSAGSHAVTLVGYNDSEGYWIVRNSWAENWGEKGYFRIKYNDASRIARSAVGYTVPAPGHSIHLAAPAHLAVIQDTLDITTEPLTTSAPVGEIRYRLRNTKDAAMATTGIIEVGTIDPIDVSQLRTGTYELSVEEINSKGASHHLVYLVNGPLDNRVAIESNSNLNRPLKGRIEFRARSTTGDVPFTNLTITITQTDGTFKRRIALDDPGPLITFGWRTENAPNGTYALQVIGYVGDAYECAAEQIIVTTSN